MPPLSEIFHSITNRIIILTVAVYCIIELVYSGQRSGFELYNWQSPNFQIWQLISHMFLHGSVPHLFLNMFGLWMFGRTLERVWGKQRFLIFYLSCGVGAAIIHSLVTHFQFQSLYSSINEAGYTQLQIENLLQTGRYFIDGTYAVSKEMQNELYFSYHVPTVGASGAIYGILAAFALLFPNTKLALIFLPVPVAAKYFVPILLLIDLTGGLTGVSIFGQNIAHFAHIGGAIVGFILVMFWRRRE